MKKILITGANSYIGTSVADYLAQWQDKYAVDTIDMVGGSWREKSFAGYDVVYHVAGIAHSDSGKISDERKAFYYRINTDLTVETAKKAKSEGVKQFIFMSSAIIYGDSMPMGKTKMITRNTVPQPANAYGDSKLQAENVILPLQDDAFNVVVLRPPMIYGKGCKGNYQTLAKLATKLPLFPDVDNCRSMLYIGNLCEFVRLMIDNEEHGIFWPQNSEYIQTSHMVELIAAAHGKRIRLTKVFNWMLPIAAKCTGLVDKEFGNLAYDMVLSEYKEDYAHIGLFDSIRKTERISKKNVWIFNQHTTPPEFGHFGRHFYFGKYLAHAGYKPVVFAGSNPHNTDTQLIEDKSTCRIYKTERFNFVFVKTCVYKNSKLKRIIAMLQYYRRLFTVTKRFEKPDVIIGSSVHPLACVAAIKLAKKYNVPCIAEIRDLWPESIVAYGIANKRNPAVKLLYQLEKWIYTKANRIIFTMEGGRDYIIEKGWDKAHGGPVNLDKVYHINNGVDLEKFDYNCEHYAVKDADLENIAIFKVVYVGSIRKANNLGLLLDVAKKIKDDCVRFLVWGDGDELESLQQRIGSENITNVVFKGRVDKKYIPSIVSQADINIMHGNWTPIMRYGVSPNKLFEYLASGRLLLANIPIGDSFKLNSKMGLDEDCTMSSESYAAQILEMRNMPKEQYDEMCSNARRLAEQYDFSILTDELVRVMEDKDEQKAL